MMLRGWVKGSRHRVALITRGFARIAPMNEPSPNAATLARASCVPARAASLCTAGSPSSIFMKTSIRGLASSAPPENTGKTEKTCTLRGAGPSRSERWRLPIAGRSSRLRATTHVAEGSSATLNDRPVIGGGVTVRRSVNHAPMSTSVNMSAQVGWS